MTSKQLDRLLERAVASALGVPVPRKRRSHRRPVPALAPARVLAHAGH